MSVPKNHFPCHRGCQGWPPHTHIQVFRDSRWQRNAHPYNFSDWLELLLKLCDPLSLPRKPGLPKNNSLCRQAADRHCPSRNHTGFPFHCKQKLKEAWTLADILQPDLPRHFGWKEKPTFIYNAPRLYLHPEHVSPFRHKYALKPDLEGEKKKKKSFCLQTKVLKPAEQESLPPSLLLLPVQKNLLD